MKNSNEHLTPEQLFEKGKELREQRKFEEAFEYYQASAEQEYAPAQCKLGECYLFAIGVEIDKNLSKIWYQRAADQGNAEAQFNLGIAYEFGLGVKKDEEQSAFWYKRAAIKGYAPAQYKIGNCYYNGRGETKDEEQALFWYKLAAEQDYAEALKELCKIYYYANEDEEGKFWFERANRQGCYIDAEIRSYYDSEYNIDEIEGHNNEDTHNNHYTDCITLPQIINKSLTLEYGTEEECRQKMINCTKKFDKLFPQFFSVAKKSFDEKEFKRSQKGDDLFYYIEENLFFILKKHYFLALNNSTLEELSDLLDFFRLLNSESPDMNFYAVSANDKNTYNRDYVVDEFLCIINSDYEELKILDLAKTLDCNNVDVLTTYNKIPQPKEVLYLPSQNNKSDYSPFYSHYFSFNFLVEEDAPHSFLDAEPNYYKIRLQLKSGENKELTDILKPSRNDNKEAFEFMCKFWYTYKTLTFNVGAKEHDAEDFIPASEEERKELVNDFKKLVFSLIENEADYLSCSAAFELCYIFSCAHYLNKTDESLLDLLTFSYVISYAQLYNIQKIKDVPEEIKKLCYCREYISANDVLTKTNELITGFFKEIKETNKQYKIRMSKSIDLVPFAPMDEFDWLGKDGIREGLMPEVVNFFKKRNQKHITLADQRFEKVAKHLINEVGYKGDALRNFLKNFEERNEHQKTMEYIYDKLYALNNIIIILSFTVHSLGNSSPITDIYFDLTEYFFSIKLERGQTPENKEFRNGEFFDEHQIRGIDRYKDGKIKSLQEEKQDLQGEIKSLQEEKQDLQGEIKSLQEEKQDLQEKIKALQENNTSLQEEIMSLQEKIKSLQEEIKSLQEEKQDLQEKIKSLQEKIKSLEEENATFQKKIFDLTESIKYFKEVWWNFDDLLNPKNSLEDIQKIKSKNIFPIFTTLKARGALDTDEVNRLEKLIQCITELIQYKASQEKGYEKARELTEQNLPLDNIRNVLIKSEVYEEKAFKSNKKKFFNSLVTGEYLYKKYVLDEKTPISKDTFDYSCVALQYYTALEHLINFLFYIPYKTTVLDPIFKKNKKIPDGYIGTAKLIRTNKESKEKELHESIMLGSVIHLYKLCDENGNQNKHIEYLKEKLLLNDEKINALSEIAQQVDGVVQYRNKAAHGGNILEKGEAEEARKNVYKEKPELDNEKSIEIASKCRELIPEILKLFEN